MKKVILASFLATTISTLALAETAAEANQPLLSGFECADEVKQMISMLGRGSDFPAFLAADVSTELKRQDKRSQLLAVECIGDPELKAGSMPIMENGVEKNVLSTLSLTFPLQLKVKNGKNELSLKIDQNYTVKNMDQPGKQKVTQNFVVH